MNTKLIEQIKAGTHCIEMPDNPTGKDVELLNRILTIVEDEPINFLGHNKYYGNYWDGNYLINSIPIPLSSFLPKMVEVDKVIEFAKQNCNEIPLSGDQVSLSKLLNFLN